MSSDPKVEEIRARLAAATPGPWEISKGWVRRTPYHYPGAGPWMGPNVGGVIGEYGEAPLIAEVEGPDAEFIANAPTDIALLLTKLDEAEEHIESERQRGQRVLELDREFLQQVADSYGVRRDAVTTAFLERQPRERAAAEERERTLIAGVREALNVRVRKEGAEGYGLAFQDMLAILSRLLPSTPTGGGKK